MINDLCDEVGNMVNVCLGERVNGDLDELFCVFVEQTSYDVDLLMKLECLEEGVPMELSYLDSLDSKGLDYQSMCSTLVVTRNYLVGGYDINRLKFN